MKKTTKHFLIILLSVLLLFSGLIVHGTKSILWSSNSDLISLTSAKAELIHKLGFIPLFDPYTNSGYPFIASPQAMAFYIPLYPLYFSGNLFFYNIIFFLQLLFAGIFMYLLAKDFKVTSEAALLAAITYMFSGYFLSGIEAGHITPIVTFTFFPLIFLLIRKILETNNLLYCIFLGYAVALSYFGGHPQFLYYAGISFILPYVMYRSLIYFKHKQVQQLFKKISLLGLASVISLALIAPSLLPTLSFSRLVTHGDSEEEKWDFVSSFSFHLALSVRFLFPSAFGSRDSYISFANYEETNPYVSLFGLFSIILSVYLMYKRKIRHEIAFIVFAFILSFLLIFGKYNPFYYLLFKYIPGFDLFRGSSRFILTVTFSASIISAFIFDYLFRERKFFRLFKKYLYAVALFSLLFVSTLAIIYMNKEEASKAVYSLYKSKNLDWGWDFEYLASRLDNAIITSLKYSLLTLFLLLPLYYILTFLNLKKHRAKYILIFIVFLDLIILSPLPKFEDVSDVFAVNPMEELFIKDYETGLYRVFVLKKNILKDEKHIPVKEYIAYRDGIYLVKGREPAVIRTYERYIGSINNQNFENKADELKNLNVKYVITNRNISAQKFELVLSVDDNLVYRFNEWHDRYRLIDSGNVSLKFYSNAERHLDVKTEMPNTLFISETYMPNWKAEIDGMPKEIELCEETFMCIKVEKGNHNVKLRYEEPLLNIGLVISIVAFFITFFYLSASLYFRKAFK